MGSRENSNFAVATGVLGIWAKSVARAGAIGRLPRRAPVIAYDRGEPLHYTGIVIYLTTGVSLMIALLMS
jgi:hypothetical protein